MNDFCASCKGTGKISKENDNGDLVREDCEVCDGTGLEGDFESFQKRRKPSRWDDEGEGE